jgi:CheY-like chemotaxis protein
VSRPHILVVDDDRSILATVSEILHDEGYQVATAANGQQALEIVAESPPTMVLLDMRMPVMDGWGFASALKQKGMSLPILMMTAAQSGRGWAEEIGAQGFLAKPFEIDDLIQAVRRMQAAFP